MIISDFNDILNTFFPPGLQESYDNTGPQIFFQDREVNSILISLDIDREVIGEAIDKKCELIISHHPFFFKPIKNIISSHPRSDMILKLIENRISVIAAHTNLDKIYHKKLSDLLGFEYSKVLFETNKVDEEILGLGSLSLIKNKMKLKDVLKLVKEKLKLEYLLYSGPEDKEVSSLALINGAGGNSIEKIINNNNIDCIITGDSGYHSIKYAIDNDVPVIDAGHYGTEKILLNFLFDQLQEYLTKNNKKKDIKIYISNCERNPIKVY